MNSSLLGAALALGLILCAAPAAAQHGTAFDVENGALAYERLCANCHGPDGNLIANIDLGRGLYRRNYADADLAAIILEGIPDTPMPPNPTMSEAQAREIVAYLRARAGEDQGTGLAGDAARGKALYEGRGDCASCHRIGAVGSRLGPDLTDIGQRRGASELTLALLEPDAEVQANHRFYRVITRDGEKASGRLLNQDTFMVLLMDEDERLRAFDKTDLREHGFISPGMPSLEGEFSDQEIADLVAYLTSLRG